MAERKRQAIRSGPFDFWLNEPYGGSARITDPASGRTIGSVLVREGCLLQKARPHPDGLLVLADLDALKITRNLKGTWSATLAGPRDFDGLPVEGDVEWRAARNRLEGT